jgi:hypothetical protein
VDRVDGSDVLGQVIGIRLAPDDPRLAPGFADEEQRGGPVALAVALALADGAVDLQLVHRGAHGLDGRAVGLVLVAAAHQARGLCRGRLGHADHLEREEVLQVSGESGAGP